MLYYGYHFGGMHLIWWFAWLLLLFGIVQRSKRNSPLDILKKRFAAGQISKEQYYEQRAVLEKDTNK